MALSLEDIDKELAARQEMGNPAVDAIDAELKRRGVDPGPSNAGLHEAGQSVSRFMQPIADASSKLMSAAPLVAGVMSPGAGLAVDAASRGMTGLDQAFQGLGGLAAENLPESMSDYQRAAAGTAISMVPQVAGALIPGPKFPQMRMLKPVAGPGREAGVAAAAEAGVPLTRAEITGAKPTSLLESGLEKSLTGSGQIQRFRQAQSAAIDRALEGVKKRFGTNEPLSSGGADAKIGMQSEMGQARELGRKLYRDIPDVPIAPTNLQKALDDLIFSNPEKRVSTIAEEVKGRLGSQAPITEATSPKPIGKTGESQYNIGPKTPGKPGVPTFQKLNDIRNMISKEIQADTVFNPISGNQIGETGRSLTPLKKALDADIEAYKSGQTTPYGKMEAETFGTAFNKANAFHGSVKDLINNKLVKKLSKAPESDVSKIVFGPGRPEDILVAKATMGQEGYAAIKKQYFNDLLESKNIGSALDKLEPEFLQAAFSAEELEALRKLDSIKKVSLGAEKVAGNTSGTAQNVATGATFAGLGHAAMKALTSPLTAAIEAAAILGIPYATAKAYLGTARGIPLPVNTASQVATRGGAAGLNSLGTNPDTRKALTAILDRMRKK